MISTAHDPLPDLLRSLRSTSSETRLRAAKSLGKLGPQALDSLNHLTHTLDDPSADVREAAAQAIGQMGLTALPIYVKMSQHTDKYVRRHAVWALGKLGAAALETLPVLCKMLKDVDPRTASGAAQALGSLGEAAAAAVPTLIEAMRGTNIVLCRLASKALSEIGTPALPALITHLRHSDPFVRGEAALAIGWIGPDASSTAVHLIEALSHGRPALLATEVEPDEEVLSKSTPTAEEASRMNAAIALGRIGVSSRIVLSVLTTALRDPSDHVRRATQNAIKQLGG